MKKYVCTVCGYAYDESAGDQGEGIAPGTKWKDVSDDWECPLCGASKSEFEAQPEKMAAKPVKRTNTKNDNQNLMKLSFGEMSALFSNLAKGSEKQYRFADAERFSKLAEFYNGISEAADNQQLSDLNGMAQQNIDEYANAKAVAEVNSDRGALRALVWGEKVTRIVSSVLSRYEMQNSDLLKDKNIYLCEICGFFYIGDESPEICPVCKVPKIKISKAQKEAI